MGTDHLAIVVGPDHEAVAAEARKGASKVEIFEQRERSGTAHAVLSARKAIVRGADDILVMFADTPLVRTETLSKLRGALADGAAVAVLGFKPANPAGLWPAGHAKATSLQRSARNATPRAKSARLAFAMAASWRSPASRRSRILEPDRQCECERRILSHRRRCHRPRHGY